MLTYEKSIPRKTKVTENYEKFMNLIQLQRVCVYREKNFISNAFINNYNQQHRERDALPIQTLKQTENKKIKVGREREEEK